MTSDARHMATTGQGVLGTVNVEETVVTTDAPLVELTKNLGEAFEVRSDKPIAVTVDCNAGKAGYSEISQYRGSDYGQKGGVVLIPGGEASDVTAQCKDKNFSIEISPSK